MFIVHGVNEHIGRYHKMAQALSKEGYVVVGHDHYSFGLSDGFRGDIESFNYLISDFKQLIQDKKKELPPKTPTFIIGRCLYIRGIYC